MAISSIISASPDCSVTCTSSINTVLPNNHHPCLNDLLDLNLNMEERMSPDSTMDMIKPNNNYNIDHCQNSGHNCQNCQNSGQNCQNSGQNCQNSGQNCQNSGHNCHHHFDSCNIVHSTNSNEEEYDSDAFNSDDSCQSVPDLDLSQLMAPAPVPAPAKRRRKKRRKAQSELLRCVECDYTTRFKEHFASHMVKHSNDRKYMCSDCGRTFKLKQALQRHMLIHRPSSRYACHICDKKFSRKDHLNTHLAMHDSNSNRRDCVCNECGAVFKNKKTLAGHMKTHEQQRKFACNQCSAQYTRIASLRRHVKYKHGNSRLLCEICNQSFSYPSTLEEHKRVAHNQGRRDFVCQNCGQAFAVKAYLAKHKISCANRLSGRRLQCQLCPKSFLSQRHLTDHVRRKHNNNESNNESNVVNNESNVVAIVAMEDTELMASPCSSSMSMSSPTLTNGWYGFEAAPMEPTLTALSPNLYCDSMVAENNDNMGSLIRLVYGQDDKNLMDNNVYMMYDNCNQDVLPSIFDVATC